MPRLKAAPIGERIDLGVGHQGDGCTYALHPRSHRLIERHVPGLEAPGQLFLEYPKREDFERVHGPLWRYIAPMLTGLTEEQMAQLGGFRIYDARTDHIVYDSQRTPTRRRRSRSR